MEAIEWAAIAIVAERELLLLTAVGIALTSLDDLFIDLVYLTRRTWRQLTVYRRHKRAFAADLTQAEGGWMALFIPAWDESAVIRMMLRLTLARLDYPRYRLFVGTYPNDGVTGAVVKQVAHEDSRVVHVLCSRPGPTTKADCLNHLWHAMADYEAEHGVRFRAIVLHDAEDIVHSRELDVFAHLIDRKAMVQLPVVPLREKKYRWIAGHYIDEFAESHGKDIVVREALGAGLPSAGVACAFDRELLGRAILTDHQGPFDADSLTEDYELGMRLRALGGHAALVRIDGKEGGSRVVTQEHFPATLETALRQKSRWLLGIALMGWDRLGWQGNLVDRYMLLRDRKALFTALLSVSGYLAACGWAMILIWRMLVPELAALPPVVVRHSPLAWLLSINAGLLLWRLLMRGIFTGKLYGWREGLLSAPRAVVGNLINFLAALRAIRRYVRIRLGYEPMRWDKTGHRFPASVPAE